tara:strand:+ start:49 stop:1125 length:1077 start_codon:yes stop_codon:yes gene_type:complete
MKTKTCIIFSTRPEIIKLFPIIEILSKQKKNFFFLNTGQHYDYRMHKVFYDEFKLKKAKYNFKKNKLNGLEYISECLKFINEVLKKEKPTHVIVQGDTDTTLCGALSTNIYNRNKNCNKKIKLFHIEAGLRSFDESMPEEINRKIVDNLSEYLFVPSKFEFDNLKKENLLRFKKVRIVGNTILESLKSLKKVNHLENKKKDYFLLTLHRPETVDDKIKFSKLLINLNKIGKKFKTKIFFPIHPRSKKKISNQVLLKLDYFKIFKPIDYLNFISLLKSCRIVLTDSGGIQEESYILNKPCVTIRNNTERQITTYKKSNIVSGYDEKKIEKSIKYLLNKKINNKNIFGKNISKKIVSEIK